MIRLGARRHRTNVDPRNRRSRHRPDYRGAHAAASRARRSRRRGRGWQDHPRGRVRPRDGHIRASRHSRISGWIPSSGWDQAQVRRLVVGRLLPRLFRLRRRRAAGMRRATFRTAFVSGGRRAGATRRCRHRQHEARPSRHRRPEGVTRCLRSAIRLWHVPGMPADSGTPTGWIPGTDEVVTVRCLCPDGDCGVTLLRAAAARRSSGRGVDLRWPTRTSMPWRDLRRSRARPRH